MNHRARSAGLFVLVGLSVVACADSAGPGPAASGRSVQGNVLVSQALPEIEIQVEDSLAYVGTTTMVLRERADAEVMFFAEANEAVIGRFFQAQFESLRDHVENGYSEHESAETTTLGGHDYALGFWCMDMQAEAEERPDSDIANVQRWLRDQDLESPGVYVGLRFVRRLGEQRRSEVILIYGEPVSLSGVDCADEESAVEFLPAIRQRGIESFAVAG